jgi:hypothetical protein
MVTIFIILSIQIFTSGAVLPDLYHELKDNRLNISSVNSLNNPGKYQDVIFEFTSENGWQLKNFNIGVEIFENEIKTIELIKVNSFPIQFFLKISGIFPDGCSQVGKVKSQLINNEFNISMYYKFETISLSCGQTTTPFVKIIQLPTYDLKKGEYLFNLNENFSGKFEIFEDNSLDI